jgi:hypothetical protein
MNVRQQDASAVTLAADALYWTMSIVNANRIERTGGSVAQLRMTSAQHHSSHCGRSFFSCRYMQLHSTATGETTGRRNVRTVQQVPDSQGHLLRFLITTVMDRPRRRGVGRMVLNGSTSAEHPARLALRRLAQAPPLCGWGGRAAVRLCWQAEGLAGLGYDHCGVCTRLCSQLLSRAAAC